MAKENKQLKYRTLKCLNCDKPISSRTRAHDKMCISCSRKSINARTISTLKRLMENTLNENQKEFLARVICHNK